MQVKLNPYPLNRQQLLKNLDQDFSAFQSFLDAADQQMVSNFKYRNSIIQNHMNRVENAIVQIRRSKIIQEREIADLQSQFYETQMWIQTKRNSIELKMQQITHCEELNKSLEERISAFKKREERLYEIINHNKQSFDKQNSMRSNINNNNNGRKSILVKKNAIKASKKQEGSYKNVEFDIENNKMTIKFKDSNGQENFMQLLYCQKDQKFLLSSSKNNINYTQKLQGLVQQFNTHLNLKILYQDFIQIATKN